MKHLGMIKDLNARERAAFVAMCCERMLLNYASFVRETNYGNLHTLRNALDCVWNWIATESRPINLEILATNCESVAPSTEEFHSIFTSAALDAATSIAIALRSIGGDWSDAAVRVAELSRDTVDLFVQELRGLDPNDEDFDCVLQNDELMRTEMSTQQRHLESLATAGISHPNLERLRNSVKRGSVFRPR